MASGRGREGMSPRRVFPRALRTAIRHRWVSLRGHPEARGEKESDNTTSDYTFAEDTLINKHIYLFH